MRRQVAGLWAGAAWLTVILAACAEKIITEPPLNGDSVVVTLSIDGPDTVTFTALGDESQLNASVTVSSGTAPALTWFATRPMVAYVDNSGRVVSLDNGETLIIARAGSARDTVTAVVEQVPVQLMFVQEPPLSAAGFGFLSDVTVGIFDRNFAPVFPATASVSLALDTSPSGATLSGTLTVAADSGLAKFTDLSIDIAGVGYTLLATTVFDTTSSFAFDVLAAPDLVRFHNLAGYQLGALFDGGNPFFVNDVGLVGSGSV